MLLMASLPRTGQGALLLLHGLAALLVGIAVGYRRWNDASGKPAAVAAAAIWTLWGLAEVGWSSSFFLSNQSHRALGVVLVTELGYSLAFGASVISMLRSIEGGLRRFFSRWVVVVPLLLTTPIAFSLILHPFLVHRDSGLTAFNLGETSAIAISYVALNLALIVLLSTRSVDWSFFAAGVLCLVFGDWSLRADKIMGRPIELGLASFFILFGLYSAALPMLRRNPIGRVQRFEPTSLLNTYRTGLLVVALSMVLVYALYQREEARTLKILCLGSSAVAFGAVLLSQVMVERIQWFSRELGRVLRSELEHPERVQNAAGAALPLELEEIYRLAFSATIREQKLREEQRALEQIRQLQAQVAHDIRSPLAALNVAVVTLQESIPEPSRRLLRGAADRIKDIANDLLDKNRRAAQDRSVPLPVESVSLCCLIDEAASEKRLQRAGGTIDIRARMDEQSYGLFAAANGRELKRVLSNLLDNAIEASPDGGRVTLRAALEGPRVLLSVSDSGRGVPAEILPRLGEQGFSFNKPQGSGLGLYHARSTVERWGGTLTIRSAAGTGTTVDLRLPRATAPAWFVEKIVLEPGMAVLVLDDDKAIHATWDQLLAPSVKAGIRVLHFAEPCGMQEWLAQHRSEPFLGVIDQELMPPELTGLDLIESEGIADRSILVTSHYAEPLVLRRAATLKLRIIPKELVGLVPIEQRPPRR
ncbi:MAG: HAMP domain-containing sensor histidine kinase [Polyangia bacterium]